MRVAGGLGAEPGAAPSGAPIVDRGELPGTSRLGRGPSSSGGCPELGGAEAGGGAEPGMTASRATARREISVGPRPPPRWPAWTRRAPRRPGRRARSGPRRCARSGAAGPAGATGRGRVPRSPQDGRGRLGRAVPGRCGHRRGRRVRRPCRPAAPPGGSCGGEPGSDLRSGAVAASAPAGVGARTAVRPAAPEGGSARASRSTCSARRGSSSRRSTCSSSGVTRASSRPSCPARSSASRARSISPPSRYIRATARSTSRSLAEAGLRVAPDLQHQVAAEPARLAVVGERVAQLDGGRPRPGSRSAGSGRRVASGQTSSLACIGRSRARRERLAPDLF